MINVDKTSNANNDEDQTDEDKCYQFLLSRGRVSAFTKVVSSFSPEQHEVVKEIGFRSTINLKYVI